MNIFTTIDKQNPKLPSNNLGYQFMFRARMYRSLIPVFNSVKDQRTAHSCAKHKLITTISDSEKAVPPKNGGVKKANCATHKPTTLLTR